MENGGALHSCFYQPIDHFVGCVNQIHGIESALNEKCCGYFSHSRSAVFRKGVGSVCGKLGISGQYSDIPAPVPNKKLFVQELNSADLLNLFNPLLIRITQSC
jgi:hypothetical protein